MEYVYSRHYTREQARSLLPQIRDWLKQLQASHSELTSLEKRVAPLLKTGDAGGPLVNEGVKTLCAARRVQNEFASRQIQIKDIARGLIDFPAIIAGHEVFLCWEQDEDDIEFWHELDAGYAGRERL